MRKDLGNKMQFMPLPVLMLATYDQDGKANVMNAAWGVGPHLAVCRVYYRKGLRPGQVLGIDVLDIVNRSVGPVVAPCV